MKKGLKRILRVGAVVAGGIMLILAAAALLVRFDKPLIRNILRDQLAKRTGMTVRIGKLDYELFPFHVTAVALELGKENAGQRIAASLARLEVRGDLRMLIGGRKPALETVEADGFVVRVEVKTAPRKPPDLDKLAGQAAEALAWTRHVSVRNGRISVSLVSLEAALGEFNIDLTPRGADGAVIYSVKPFLADLRDKDRGFALACRLSSSGTIRPLSSPSIEGSFSLESPRVRAPGVDEAFEGATARLTGWLDRIPREFAITGLELSVPGLLSADATGKGSFASGVSMEADIHAQVEKLESMAARFGSRLPAELRSAKLRGAVELSAKCRFGRSGGASNAGVSGAMTFHGVDTELRGVRLRGGARLTGRYELARSNETPLIEGALDLDGVALDTTIAGAPLHLDISGGLKAKGTLRDPGISADLRSSVGKISLPGLTIGGAAVRLVGSSTKTTADISGLEAVLTGIAVDAAPVKGLSFAKLTLSGKARMDLARRTAILDGLVSGIPGIPPLVFKGRVGPGDPPSAEIRLEGQDLDVPALRALAAPFLPESLASWDLVGSANLSLEARRPASAPGRWRFAGGASFAGVRFNDPSFTVAGEGLDPVLKFEGSLTPAKEASFAGGLDIGSGESLWKTIYVSWSRHPLKATFAGRLDPAMTGIEGLTARFLFPGLGKIDVAGSFAARPSPAFSLKIDSDLSLGPLYSLTAQPGASRSNRLGLAGNMAASILARKTGEALSVEGRIALADTSASFPASGIDLAGVTAEIPVRYSSAVSATTPPEGPLPDEGFIHIAELRSPILTLKPMNVSLRVGTNAFAVEPFSFDLFGGRLELGRTEFRVDPRTGALRGEGSLALRELDISMFSLPPQFKLTGRARADFPLLEIGSRQISVSGRGEADVFGGKVILRDLAVADPFSPGRSISMNVDLLDLDMKKLTDEVPFGEVTGIVRGEIRGLVLSYGQPARFDFRIESVRRKGVSQTFSLKAVDNLTVLSSGQTASAGTGPFWIRFVRGFRYARLGIVSTLRNDTFTLNGTIHEGGVEYLVKKPALFGINVVNRMPDKKISFKEMTGRLKRVGQSEKTEGVSTRREP